MPEPPQEEVDVKAGGGEDGDDAIAVAVVR